MKRLWLIFLTVCLAGCVGLPSGIQPVSGFQAERYLSTWYEIVRLDHGFERGMSGGRPSTASATTAESTS